MAKENLTPSPEGQGEPLFEKHLNLPVLGGICEILDIKILGEKKDGLIYRGNITFMDHMEVFKGSKSWIAKPGRQKLEILGRIYHIDINPTNSFWGSDRFTLLQELDDAMRHQILHSLIELNPSLPFTTVEQEPRQLPLL